MRKLLIILSMAALLLTSGVTQVMAAKYTPVTGALFNNPTGSVKQQYRLDNELIAAINSTKKGETIRIAVFTFDYKKAADALINAHKRGVHVQILFNDRRLSPKVARLQQVLGTNYTKKHFAIVCKSGCRSTAAPASLHSKFYLFSKTGGAAKVVMTGSVNPTKMQAHTGWNDLYTIVGHEKIYNAFTMVFDQMKKDQPVEDPYVHVEDGTYDVSFFPRPGNSDDTDNVLETLGQIKCNNVAKGYGHKGKTVVKLNMFAWDSGRGLKIANKLWQLDDNGCDVSIILSSKGFKGLRDIILKKTRHGGIKVVNSRKDTNGDGIIDQYSHAKYLMINGNFKGSKSAKYVLTGSQNYTIKSLRNGDEVMLGIMSDKAYDSYDKNFKFIASKSTPMKKGASLAKEPVFPRAILRNGENLD